MKMYYRDVYLEKQEMSYRWYLNAMKQENTHYVSISLINEGVNRK